MEPRSNNVVNSCFRIIADKLKKRRKQPTNWAVNT